MSAAELRETRLPRVFVGSSGKAQSGGYLDRAEESLREVADVTPWTKLVGNNREILKSILAEIRRSDFAIFLLHDDDRLDRDGVEWRVARDNVIHEWGQAVAVLGVERTAALVEHGVDVPTDWDGYSLQRFRKTNQYSRNDWAEFDCEMRKIAAAVAAAGFRERTPVWELPSTWPEYAQVNDVLVRKQQELREVYRDLHRRARSVDAEMQPLRFYSNRDSVQVYLDGLERVKQRFLTTTRLDSPFWREANRAPVIRANKRMRERLRTVQGAAQRIFLVPESFEDFKADLRSRVDAFRRRGDHERVEGLLGELRDKLSTVKTLADQDGVESRICFGMNERAEHGPFPEDVEFHPLYDELAIFDAGAVHFYRTAPGKEIYQVTSYFQGVQDFDHIRFLSDSYFYSLWESAEDAATALASVIKLLSQAAKRIDCVPQWLGHYDLSLPARDTGLKESEMAFVVRELGAKRSPLSNGLLDVGTCTGRYLLGLEQCFDPAAPLVGVDDDEDCIVWVREKIRMHRKPRERFELLCYDFLDECVSSELRERTFDVITFMLGTLSHFGNHYEAGHDGLSAAFKRAVRHLASEGSVFVGNWRKDVRAGTIEPITIYMGDALARLTEWTPSETQVRAAAAAAGLKVVKHTTLEDRLDVFHFARSEESRTPAASSNSTRKRKATVKKSPRKPH